MHRMSDSQKKKKKKFSDSRPSKYKSNLFHCLYKLPYFLSLTFSLIDLFIFYIQSTICVKTNCYLHSDSATHSDQITKTLLTRLATQTTRFLFETIRIFLLGAQSPSGILIYIPYILRDNYNMLLILQLEPFLP